MLTEAALKHPCWLSWTAHCAVVSLCLAHVFADADADRLSTLIKEHADAFDDVEEYDDLDRPKHHFQKHLVQALRNFGPFRGFWCFPFEAFMQVTCCLFPFSNL